MILSSDSLGQALRMILHEFLEVNWVVFSLWWALTIGAVLLKRTGTWWGLLSFLHLPLVMVVGVWCWGRDGFNIMGNTLLCSGCTKAAVFLLAGLLIKVRKLTHLRAPGFGRALRSIISGPVGLSSALDLLVSAMMPAWVNTNAGSSAEAESPFAKAPDLDTGMEIQAAAQGLGETFRKLWDSNYEAVPVEASTFKHLDLAFYDRFRDTLGSYGFTHAGDVEVVSARMPGVKRTFIRVMLSSDHGVMASCNHVKLGVGMRMMTLGARNFVTQTTEFESEFTDGSFVVTTSQTAVRNFDHGDPINSMCFEGLSLEELGHRHYQRLAEHGQARRAGLRSIRTLEEVNASQARLQALKSAGRGAEGMTRDEFRRASGSSGQMSDELYEAWQATRQQTA